MHAGPEDEQDMVADGKKRKSKKKKKAITTVEVLPPTKRDVNMAGAYGG